MLGLCTPCAEASLAREHRRGNTEFRDLFTAARVAELMNCPDGVRRSEIVEALGLDTDTVTAAVMCLRASGMMKGSVFFRLTDRGRTFLMRFKDGLA